MRSHRRDGRRRGHHQRGAHGTRGGEAECHHEDRHEQDPTPGGEEPGHEPRGQRRASRPVPSGHCGSHAARRRANPWVRPSARRRRATAAPKRPTATDRSAARGERAEQRHRHAGRDRESGDAPIEHTGAEVLTGTHERRGSTAGSGEAIAIGAGTPSSARIGVPKADPPAPNTPKAKPMPTPAVVMRTRDTLRSSVGPLHRSKT